MEVVLSVEVKRMAWVCGGFIVGVVGESGRRSRRRFSQQLYTVEDVKTTVVIK